MTANISSSIINNVWSSKKDQILFPLLGGNNVIGQENNSKSNREKINKLLPIIVDNVSCQKSLMEKETLSKNLSKGNIYHIDLSDLLSVDQRLPSVDTTIKGYFQLTRGKSFANSSCNSKVDEKNIHTFLIKKYIQFHTSQKKYLMRLYLIHQ